jgi:hypothetical protein
VVLDYIAGRRLAYSSPFRYAFVIATLSVLAIHAPDISVTAPGVPIETERDRAAVQLIVGLTPYLFFPAVMLVAALQRLASRSARFNYSELLVFDAFCIGHGGLIGVLVAAVLPPGSPAGLGVMLGLQAACLGWCQRGFRGVSWGEALGRASLLVVGNVVPLNLIGMLIVNALASADLLQSGRDVDSVPGHHFQLDDLQRVPGITCGLFRAIDG